jgi:predicted Zn-dependent protease
MLHRVPKVRRIFYALLSITVMLGVFFGPTLRAIGINWVDVIQKGINVIQVSNISDEQEMEIGKQLNERVAKEMKLSSTSDLAKYVNEIGQKLVPYSGRPKLKYTFQVVDDKAINAFATLGGYVYINTGVIQVADDEAQLASVIGHEIGHIGGKHSVKRVQSAAKAELGLSVVGIKTTTLVNLAYELLLSRPHSRQAELDADVRGFEMISRNNYDQQEMPNFMRKLMDDKRTQAPTILSTHPAIADRVTALEKLAKDKANGGKLGTDPIAYAKRVGKTPSSPAATPAAVVKPTPTGSPTPTVSPTPTASPAPSKTGDVVVPTN